MLIDEGREKKLDIGNGQAEGEEKREKTKLLRNHLSTFFTTTPEESKNAGIIHIVHCRLPPGQRALGDTY